MIRSHAKRNEGFSIVEILIAASIISVTVVAIVGIASESIVFSRRAVTTYVASTLLEEGVEAVRTMRDTSWNSVASLAAGTTYYPVFSNTTHMWSLDTTPATVNGYTRTVSVAPVSRGATDDIVSSGGTADAGTRLVTVTVSWVDHGSTLTKSIAVYFSNIFE